MPRHSSKAQEVVYKNLDFTGFPGYRIGNDSSIWTYKKDKRCRPRWKLMKQSTARYKVVTFSHNRVEKRFYVHILLLTAFVGPCPEGMQCRHLNGDNYDNRLENLCWGTAAENAKDRVLHGTSGKGMNNPRAKLTDDDVRFIRKLHATGKWTFKDLGVKYDVHYSVIADAVRRVTWANVE